MGVWVVINAGWYKACCQAICAHLVELADDVAGLRQAMALGDIQAKTFAFAGS